LIHSLRHYSEILTKVCLTPPQTNISTFSSSLPRATTTTTRQLQRQLLLPVQPAASKTTKQRTLSLFFHSHISVLLLFFFFFFCFVSSSSSLIDKTRQTLRRDKTQTQPRKAYTPARSLYSDPLSTPAPALPHLTVSVYIPETATDFRRREASFSSPLCLCRLLSTADFSPPPACPPRCKGSARSAGSSSSTKKKTTPSNCAWPLLARTVGGGGGGPGRAGGRAGEGESTAFICLNLDIEFFFSLSHIILNRRMTQKKI